jgi:hypothetical protein
MTEVIEQASGVFELMIAFMCAKHAQPIAGFPLQIIQLSETQRRQKHVRFSYASQDGIPFITPG